MAKLIISTDGRDKVYEIIDERFTIGSGPDADLQLRSDGVAGIHLTIDKTKTGYRVIDMETKEGTIINGKQLNQHVLTNGDTIELGGIKITYIGKGGAKSGGPASRSRGKGQGQKLESSNYYRHARKETLSPGARFAIIGSIIVGVVLVLWIGLGATQPPESDFIRTELRERIRMCESGMVYEDEIVASIRKYSNKPLDDEHMKLLKRLKADWSDAQQSATTGAKSKQSGSDWNEIHNTQMAEPNNRDKLTRLCTAFIEKYADTPGRAQMNIKKCKVILADMEALGAMSPDELEIARVQGLVRVALAKKDHHEAMRGLLSMDGAVKAGQPEIYEKIRGRIRRKSRQFLGVRKNNVREFLRADKYDPARARRIAVDEIFSKLLFSVVEDYLDSPDKYDLPKNQLAEEKTQDLLRDLLKEMKPNY